VKRFAVCYWTVVLSVCLSVCPVCNIGVLWPNGCMDQDETWHSGRPRPCPHCVRWGPSSPSPKGAQPPYFRPISVVTKWLDGSRCHLARRQSSAQAAWCYMRTQLPAKGAHPTFQPMWPNGCPSQLLLSSCSLLFAL